MKIKVFAILLILTSCMAFAGTMSVQVQKSKVRATPSQLGKTVDTVNYGDTVDAGELEKSWYPVTTKTGKNGWLHESALSKKPIKMSAGTTTVSTGVSSDEVALAGKGFNEQVEAKLKAEGTLNFTWVDHMINYNIDTEKIITFRANGHLEGGDK